MRIRLPYFIRKPYYRLRLFKRFLKYPYWGAWEIVEPMLEIPFEMFCEFYEQNEIKNIGRINIEDEPEEYGQRSFAIYQNAEHDKMDALYIWWTQTFKQREDELETLLTEWALHQVCWWGNYNNEYYEYHHNCSKYGNYLFDMLNKEEQKFEQEKEENLIKLIKLRSRLWT